MPTTETKATETTQLPPRRGFRGVPCIKCGEADGVTVDLYCLENFHCTSCDEDFGIEGVRRMLEAWVPVLAWIATAPVAE